MVDFFLSDLPGKQQLELQQLLPSYSHWPTISLALADSLESTDAKMDLVLTTARLLVRHDFEIQDANNWQQELRLKILTLANDDLAVRIANDPAGESADWTRLKIFLTGVMQQRQRLIDGVDLQKTNSTETSETLFDLAVKVAEAETGRKNLGPIAETLSLNELDQLAVLNQLIYSERARALPISTIVTWSGRSIWSNASTNISPYSVIVRTRLAIIGQALSMRSWMLVQFNVMQVQQHPQQQRQQGPVPDGVGS